jgi:hypothetical protein
MLPGIVKAEFEKHISMHEAVIQQKMMEQAMMGMAPGSEQPTALPSEQASQMPAQTGQTSEQLQ